MTFPLDANDQRVLFVRDQRALVVNVDETDDGRPAAARTDDGVADAHVAVATWASSDRALLIVDTVGRDATYRLPPCAQRVVRCAPT